MTKLEGVVVLPLDSSSMRRSTYAVQADKNPIST